MIFHISSRVASSSTPALLSPVLLTGCPVADPWSPRNQRPNSTSRPITHRRAPNTTALESKDSANCRWSHRRTHYSSAIRPFYEGRRCVPCTGWGPTAAAAKWGLFCPNPSTKEGPQKEEGKDHISNHRDSLQLQWNHMCKLPSSKQINTNLLAALPQAESHGQEDWAWLAPAT